MEEIVKTVTVALGSIIEGFATLVVAHGIVLASIRYIGNTIVRKTYEWDIRIRLGKSLALSLEFLLAADVVRTAIAPTWEDIGKLTAIAALRTLLNYFLERELKRDHVFPTGTPDL